MYKFRLMLKVLLENQPYLRLTDFNQSKIYIFHSNFIRVASTSPNNFIHHFFKHPAARLGFVV